VTSVLLLPETFPYTCWPLFLPAQALVRLRNSDGYTNFELFNLLRGLLTAAG